MPSQPRAVLPPSVESGFTLLELALVVVILSLLLGGGLSILQSRIEQARYEETIKKMDVIGQELENYLLGKQRLPCPADPTQLISSSSFGWEANGGTATGDCTASGVTVVDDGATDYWAIGAVPTKRMDLPDDYAFDGWGRRFTYGVTMRMTAGSAHTTVPVTDTSINAGAGIIKNTNTSGTTITSRAMVVIVSHGPNGHGAYLKNGTRLNASITNTDELDNCNCTSTAAAGTIDKSYVQKAPTEDSTNSLNSFDDIVRYYMRYHFFLPATNSPTISAF